MLSFEQNDSKSEEINVIDESQAENRPVSVQEVEITWKKKFPCRFVVLRGRSKDNSRSPLTAGLCFNPSSRVARLAGVPSHHINRPLNIECATGYFLRTSRCPLKRLSVKQNMIKFSVYRLLYNLREFQKGSGEVP